MDRQSVKKTVLVGNRVLTRSTERSGICSSDSTCDNSSNDNNDDDVRTAVVLIEVIIMTMVMMMT